MILISKEEILKLADMSRLEVRAEEIESLILQLQSVLTYAQRVQEISADIQQETGANHNMVRDDSASRSDAQMILDRCPRHEAGYFIVPAVLSTKSSGE